MEVLTDPRQSQRYVGSIDKGDRIHDKSDGNDAKPANGDVRWGDFWCGILPWCGDHQDNGAPTVVFLQFLLAGQEAYRYFR